MKKNYSFSISDTITNFLSRPVRYVSLGILLISVLFPLYWLAVSSVKVQLDYLKFPPVFIPTRVTGQNYADIFQKYGAWNGLVNTFVIAMVTAVICVFFGSMAAYAIAKGSLSRKLRNVFGLWFMIQKMYPAISTAIPVYVVMRHLGLMDTKAALIIMNVSFNLPLIVWLMIGFFQEVPREIEQSGEIDGCNMWQRFILLAVPITKPGLIASAILTLVAAWNEFLFATILSVNRAKTLSVAIAGFISDRGLEWGPMAAMAMLLIIPPAIVVWMLQKNFVAGLAMGSVKE